MAAIQMKGTARGRCPLRTPDQALEPQDEEPHLRRATASTSSTSRRPCASGTRGELPTKSASEGRPSSSWPTAPGPGAHRRAGRPLRRLLREQPLAGRHADQLRHHQEEPREVPRDRGHPGRSCPHGPALQERAAHPEPHPPEAEASSHGITTCALPDVIFVIDPHREDIAVTEAKKIGIKVVGIVDTNCDPDMVDYVIPTNDDAIRSILLFSERVADSILEGRQSFRDKGDSDEMKKMMAEKMEAEGWVPTHSSAIGGPR